MNYRDTDSGVSAVVGEMLMIVLVIVLLSVFSAALYNFLPVSRDPSINIMMSNDTAGKITLWHKGGDWVNVGDLTVIVVSGDETHRFCNTTCPNAFTLVPTKTVFDLGSTITAQMPSLKGNETVKLVTPHSVIFTGKVGP